MIAFVHYYQSIQELTTFDVTFQELSPIIARTIRTPWTDQAQLLKHTILLHTCNLPKRPWFLISPQLQRHKQIQAITQCQCLCWIWIRVECSSSSYVLLW